MPGFLAKVNPLLVGAERNAKSLCHLQLRVTQPFSHHLKPAYQRIVVIGMESSLS
jgi:hypothetical protein